MFFILTASTNIEILNVRGEADCFYEVFFKNYILQH